MDNLIINLEQANKMLNYSNLNNNIYMRLYSFATENINGYLKYFDLKNKSLLTVGSSGDQILNVYKEGCRDITLIDINPFAKYFINLKIAGILSFTYEEFQDFFFKWTKTELNNKRFSYDTFKKLSLNLKAIDYDSFYFFNRIFHLYSRERISDYLMNDDQDNTIVIKSINNYLNNEESYNKLKTILKDISFKFIEQDIFKFNENLKYDNIFLSNICTTTGIFSLKELLIKLNNNNLKELGSILIGYLWSINYNSNEEGFDWKEIYRMPATRTFLKEFITEHYNIRGTKDILFNKDDRSDLVMIYRKK